MQLELLIFRRRHAHRVGLACAAVVLGFREKRGVHYPRELGDGVWLSERVWEASQSLPGVETGEGNGGMGTMGNDILLAIGSRVSANEEADGLCRMGTGPPVQ